MAYKLIKSDHKRLEEIKEVLRAVSLSLDELHTDFTETAEAMRDKYSDASDYWRESDRGEAVGEWLDSLEEMLDKAQSVTTEIDDLAEAIEELPEKPES